MVSSLPTTPLTWRQLAVLGALLLLPLLAMGLLAARPWAALGCLVVMSAATYGLYAYDKFRAQSGGWRIPESRLHLLALLGGWPGAYIAQRRFRHKTARKFFQAVFWIIVAAYQAVALDGLLGWPLLGQTLVR